MNENMIAKLSLRKREREDDVRLCFAFDYSVRIQMMQSGERHKHLHMHTHTQPHVYIDEAARQRTRSIPSALDNMHITYIARNATDVHMCTQHINQKWLDRRAGF